MDKKSWTEKEWAQFMRRCKEIFWLMKLIEKILSYFDVSNVYKNRRDQSLLIKFKILKEIRKKMAYYFCFSNQQVLPCYYPNNIPYYTPFQFISSSPSFQNNNAVPTPEVSPQGQAQKSTQELQTVAPEDPIQNMGEAVRNRRKRQRNLDRELVSAKKNSESNIINHFFTFFILREFSETVVRRAIRSLGRTQIDNEKVMTVIYNIIRVINLKRGRKYINKAILCSYFTEEWLLSEIDNIDQQQMIPIKEIAVVLRKCLYNFTNQVSLTSILTSKRITNHSKRIHLDKRRKVLNYIHYRCQQ